MDGDRMTPGVIELARIAGSPELGGDLTGDLNDGGFRRPVGAEPGDGGQRRVRR